MSVSKDITDRPVLENTSFTLTCRVRGTPRPRISWVLNTKDVDRSRYAAENISTSALEVRLVVRGATPKDHKGIYYCVAKNDWGVVRSRDVKVDIKGMTSETSTNLIDTQCDAMHALYYLLFQ